MGRKAFEGVTILAASTAESGPVGTSVLGMLGAEVWHLDRLNDNPDFRPYGFLYRHICKKSITLDTKTPEGRELLWKLIDKCDVFFENYAPGAYDRAGFSYEAVRVRRPDIIYVSLKGFAKGNRWENCITFDPISCAYGGSAYISGEEGGGPMLSGINIGDSGSGINLAMAISAALLYKKLTGRGQYVEFSMQHAVTIQCRHSFAELYEAGNVRRAGNAYRGTKPCAPHNIYPTLPGKGPADGDYIMIACSAEDDSPDFANLCKAIDRPDLLTDPRFATPALRYENREFLDTEITKWTLQHDKHEAMRIISCDHKVPAAACNSIGELFNDEYLRTTVLNEIPDPRTEGFYCPTQPARMSDSPMEPYSPIYFGHANKEIYGGVLGLSDEEIARLKENKVI